MVPQQKKQFSFHVATRKIIFLVVSALCLTPFVSPPLALVSGFVIVHLSGNPYKEVTQKIIGKLLQFSVVGLGFGMNINSALKAGKEGFLFTVVSITSVLLLGFLISKALKVEKISGFLISAGTAICGGSAIAAVSPVVKADSNQISLSLAVVFILNSVALLLFPVIGNLLNLTQHQFGLWSAIAIHDTSSVVGAASRYGNEALEVATTVKLARALWIIPLSLLSVMLFNNKETKIKIPWFIGFFIIAMAINTYLPGVQVISPYIVALAKAGLTLTLFFIGAGLSVQAIKKVGVRPLIFAIILWVFISCTSLWVIMR